MTWLRRLAIGGLLSQVFAVMALQDVQGGDLARIRIERQVAEAQFRQAADQCQHAFAVNDCIDRAKVERRTVMDRLRQQEIALEDRRRSERAAARSQAARTKNAQSDVRAAGKAPPGVASAGLPSGSGSPLKAGPVAESLQRALPPPVRDQAAEHDKAASQAARRAAEAKQRQARLAQHRLDVMQRNEAQAKKRAPSPGLPVAGRQASAAASSGR